MESLDESLKIAIFTILATFAGVVGYLKKSYHSFVLREFFIEAAASGFVGLFVTLICLSANVDPYLMGALSGIAGYLGADTVKHVFYSFVQNKTGINLNDKNKPL